MGPSQGYHLPLVADLLPSPPLTLSEEVTPNGCVTLGSPLPAPSLTVLTSKLGGDNTPHGTAREEEDKCRVRLTGSLLARGAGASGQWSCPALPSVTPLTGFQALGRTTLAGIPHPGLGPRI